MNGTIFLVTYNCGGGHFGDMQISVEHDRLTPEAIENMRHVVKERLGASTAIILNVIRLDRET